MENNENMTNLTQKGNLNKNRESTIISGPLQEQIDSGAINLIRLLGP